MEDLMDYEYRVGYRDHWGHTHFDQSPTSLADAQRLADGLREDGCKHVRIERRSVSPWDHVTYA